MKISKKWVPIESMMKKLCLNDAPVHCHASTYTLPTCPTVPICSILPITVLPTCPTVPTPVETQPKYAVTPNSSVPLQKNLMDPTYVSELYDDPEPVGQANGNVDDKFDASVCLEEATSTDA